MVEKGPSTANHISLIRFSAREEPIIYINKLPFVLRDSDSPLTNIKRYQGISASRLEQMEARLKEDVIREATKYNGLLLVHDELHNSPMPMPFTFQSASSASSASSAAAGAGAASGTGANNSFLENRVIPTWTSVDIVETPREIFESLSGMGFRVRYIRIPISPEQAPEDRYLGKIYLLSLYSHLQPIYPLLPLSSPSLNIDEYVDIITKSKTTDALVFNCGMGVGRTTFAMVAAMIARRAQIVIEGCDDPIPIHIPLPVGAPEGSQTDLLNMEESESQNRAMLRLVFVLEKGKYVQGGKMPRLKLKINSIVFFLPHRSLHQNGA